MITTWTPHSAQVLPLFKTLIQGNARVLLSSATSATTRTANRGRGVAVSASQHAVRASTVACAISMGEQGKDRGFTAEKRQDTGAGLSEVVKTDG